jgi:hypothetical protein
MDEKELLNLAIEFLKTEAGKKAIGTDLDIDKIISATKKLPKSKKEDKAAEANLSKEELKAKRKKEREEKKQSRKEENQKLKDRVKEYIPKIEKFKVNGRLLDSISGESLAFAKIIPVLAIGKEVQTDELGRFTIELGIPILPYNQKALVQTVLLATKDGYVPTDLQVLTGARMVKSDIKVKKLLNIKKASELESEEVRNFIIQKTSEAQKLAYSISEKVINIRRKAIFKMQNIILFKLIPLAIGLLVIFKITKKEDLKKAQCPTPEQLQQAIRKRNRIVRQLNQIYAMLAVNAALAVLFNFIAIKLKEVDLQLAGITTTPPAPIPLLQIQRVREIIQEFIKQNKNLNISLIVALVFLVAALIILLLILKAIDQLIFKCAPESQLEAINEELRNLEKETAEENAVAATNQVNGFTIEVQEIDKNEVNGLKRRQAVGKNAQGVILVKGDASFSAEDTILINELAYYIKSNDLKAY